jgi:hypothetical protein
MRNEDIIKAAVGVSMKYGFTRDNTLFAHSYCPDEINHEVGDLSDYLTSYFNTFFSLGGLAGIPFSGKTGFGAFAHHVPAEGNIFVLFAPHVAVSQEGKVGYYHRLFQEEESTACGAGVGGYNAVKDLLEAPKVDSSSNDF